VVNEYAAHHLCSHAEEVRAVLPTHLRLVNQAQVRLMNQCRRFQRMALLLLPQIRSSQLP